MKKVLIASLAGMSLFTVALVAQQKKAATPAQEWPTYNHDLAATRFSPLTEINTGNVAALAHAWTYTFPAPPGGRGRGGGLLGGSEAVPIVVGGVMYLPVNDSVVALEADTGKVIWQRDVQGGGPGGAVSRRGVAYWPGDRNTPDRVFVTAGRRLLSYDAGTGKPSEGFGTNGEVDMVVGYAGTPTIYKNVIMVGASVNEVPQGPPGDTRAFDAVTGKKLWDFHTVPRPGEAGHETWLDDGWKDRSGTNTWGFSESVDEARGIAYLPIAGPASNYYGGDRPGNDLFGNSVVAVDIATGKRLWHFQTVHHDIWDIDMSAAPGLIDIKQGGRTIPALATVGKDGLMFILDRTNGKPVFGVEERPVPKGDVPGEWYSPTQPFPVKPPPLAKNSFKKDDMVRAADTNAVHVANCQALWDRSGGFINEGPFTPFMYHAEGTPPRSTIQFPGGTGGVNWGGTATDPRTGYIYVNAHDTSLVGWVEKTKPGVTYSFDEAGAHLPYDRASVDGVGPFHTFSASAGKDANGRDVILPCQRPPWSRLVAVNANTGEIAWQTTLGVNDFLPPGKQNVGGSGSAGPTVTAGGLVFVGATDDRRFRAFDSKTGKELWATKLDASANANPMTYQAKNGKQYVAIVATNQIVVFALP
ncbi:MAG TPA: PQQ-binding-like beta-propeller repeat protein [Vicinamibacterales bacterium]|nr:PQQ-binding-like beta-propeller repeat protein [Vicinamibacterales bacterium]